MGVGVVEVEKGEGERPLVAILAPRVALFFSGPVSLATTKMSCHLHSPTVGHGMPWSSLYLSILKVRCDQVSPDHFEQSGRVLY